MLGILSEHLFGRGKFPRELLRCGMLGILLGLLLLKFRAFRVHKFRQIFGTG